MNTNNEKDQKLTLYLPRLDRIQSIRNNALRESGGDAEVEVGIAYTDLLDVLDAAEVARKMREAIKEAHAALLAHNHTNGCCCDACHAMNGAHPRHDDICVNTQSALDKLQPFLK